MTRRSDAGDGGRADDSAFDDFELDDRDRVFAEAPAAFLGPMWFTPDESVPGGVRPLTEDELRAVTDLVRATQVEVVADQIDTADDSGTRPGARETRTALDDKEQEWQR